MKTHHPSVYKEGILTVTCKIVIMTNQRLLGFRNVMHILKTVLKDFDKVIRGGGLLSD